MEKEILQFRREIATELLDTLDDASQSVFYVIQDGKFVFGNKNGCRITGLDSQRDVQGKPALKYVHPDDKELIASMARKVMNGENIHPFEWRLHTVDGNIVWVLGFLVKITFRERPALLGSYIDISQIKETRSELQKTSRKLEEATLNLRLVREEERAHIAWEIQENLGSTLESLRTEISGLLKESSPNIDKKDLILHKIDLAQDALSRIWSHMNPPEHGHQDLAASIRWQASEFEGQTGIPLNLDLPGKKTATSAKDTVMVSRLFHEILKTLAELGSWQSMDIVLRQEKNRMDMEFFCHVKNTEKIPVFNLKEAPFRSLSARIKEWDGSLQAEKRGKKVVLKATLSFSQTSADNKIRVLLGSEQPILMEGIKQILSDMEGVSITKEANTFLELMEKVEEPDFDILLLDTVILGGQSTYNLQKIKYAAPFLPILAFHSNGDDDDFGVRMFRQGASGFLSQSSSVNELIAAVRKISLGRKHVSNRIAEKLAFEVDIYASKPFLHKLSDRERQVMFMIAEGKAMKEIAEELCLSYKTIATYRTRVLEKMNMHTNTEIVRYVVSKGLI